MAVVARRHTESGGSVFLLVLSKAPDGAAVLCETLNAS
jgi:hypothetical protein